MSKIIANYNRFCLLLIYPSFHNSTLYEKQKIFREMSPGFVSTQRKSMGSNVVGLPTFFQKYFICSAEERKSHRFGIFGVNYPFKRLSILVNHAKITIQKPDYKSHVVSMPFMCDIIIMYMTTLQPRQCQAYNASVKGLYTQSPCLCAEHLLLVLAEKAY